MHSRRTLWWAFLVLATVDLVFFSGASNYLAAPQSRLLTQGLVAGAGAVAVVLAWRGRLDLRSPLILPGVAFIAVTALATLTSQRPEASREALALLLLAAPSYLLVRAVHADAWFRSRIDGLLILAGFGFTVAYLIQAFLQWGLFWSVVGPAIPPLRPGDVGLTVGTVNAVSLYLELLVPLGLALAWARWHSRRFTVAYAGLALFAIVVTGSRGAWLGVAAGLATVAVVGWVARGRPRPRRLAIGSANRAVVIGLTSVAVVALVALAPALLARVAGGDAGRIELWSAGWSLFADHPLTGVGPGAWPGMRPLTPITQNTLAVLYATHSSVVQILTELGVAGAAAVTWLTVAVAAVARRAWRTASSGDHRVVVGACAASLAAFGVHSLVDVQTHIPAVALLLMLVVVRLDPAPDASTVEGGDVPPYPARVVAASLAAPVIVGFVLLIPIDVAMIRASFGNDHLDRGQSSAAAVDYDAAVALHDLPIYRLGQGIARAHTGDDQGALDGLDSMEAREPFTFVRSAQATLLERLGRSDAADALLTGIEAEATYDPTALLQAAVVRARREAAGSDRVRHDLAAVMGAIPSLIHSTPPAGLFTDADWSRAQLDAIASLMTTDPSIAAEEAIRAGLADVAAAARVMLTDPDQLALLDELQVAVDGGAVDFDRVDAMVRASATSATVQRLAWAIGFAARSQPLIDRVGRLSGVVFFGPPPVPMEIVVDGASNADWSLRLPRYPNAASSRLGPDRPYLPGLVTIEPVHRPRR